MDKHDSGGAVPPHFPHYTLGLDRVDIDDVLEACELVGRVLRSVAPEINPRAAARLLAEATRSEHHDAPLTQSILVEVARAIQRRDLQ